MVLLVAVCFCSGCTSVTVGEKFNTEQMANFKAGVTTKEDVLQVMGAPLDKTTNTDGTETWLYVSSETSSQITPATFLIPFYAGAKSKSKTTMYRFNFKNGVLHDTTTGERKMKTEASAVPFYTSVKTTVDDDDGSIKVGRRVIVGTGEIDAIVKVGVVPKEKGGDFNGEIVGFMTAEAVTSYGQFKLGDSVTFNESDVKERLDY